VVLLGLGLELGQVQVQVQVQVVVDRVVVCTVGGLVYQRKASTHPDLTSNGCHLNCDNDKTWDWDNCAQIAGSHGSCPLVRTCDDVPSKLWLRRVNLRSCM